MAVKQVAKTSPGDDLHEQWVDYLFWAHNAVGAMRMRTWCWPEDSEGC